MGWAHWTSTLSVEKSFLDASQVLASPRQLLTCFIPIGYYIEHSGFYIDNRNTIINTDRGFLPRPIGIWPCWRLLSGLSVELQYVPFTKKILSHISVPFFLHLWRAQLVIRTWCTAQVWLVNFLLYLRRQTLEIREIASFAPQRAGRVSLLLPILQAPFFHSLEIFHEIYWDISGYLSLYISRSLKIDISKN